MVTTNTNNTIANTGSAGSTATTGTTGASGTTKKSGSASTGIAGATLGSTDFLTLMLAQLKNQDPTSPVDSNTFLTQLAQLSQVQGINTLNTSFNTLSSSMTSSQALQASSLLGHSALVQSKTANLTSGGKVTGAVSVPQTTSSVVLSVSNAAGTVVKNIYLGAQSTGNAVFTWDGTDSNGNKLAAGTYTLKASYAGQTNISTAPTTLVNGTVSSVSMGAGTTGMTLNVSGVGTVPFTSLSQVSN